ncbi:peptidylprolyl isomerase [Phenylobacterium sp.]|uniref:peptidylprolyl isomerase n=1 Tax=Phenylobacterium sp. TaxID=1871053 RepID=UPI002DEA969E|nr:peptidylprolyl isomerase [Phenylobacterium sp.]
MAAAKSLRPAQLAGLVLALSLALCACGKGGGAEKPPERGDVAVATVDNQTVWASDVKREAVTQGLIGEGEPLDVSSDIFHRVLDQVIDQKLLAGEALKRKLDKDPVAQRRLAAARERILGDILVESVVADAVNENAIRGLYQEQLKLAKRAEEIHARQIVLPTQAEAEAVRKMAQSGASFEALAMEKSTDSATRFNGGDMGYFTTDVMPEAYAGALKTAKAGQLIGPIPVDGGFALLKVEDRRLEPPLTFEAARPQIVRFLTYDQIRDQLEKLRARSKIVRLVKADGAGAPVPPADAPKITPAPPAPKAQAEGKK